MNTYVLLLVVFILIIITLAVLIIKSRKEINRLNAEYGDIIDVEAERDKISQEVEQIKSEKANLQEEYKNKKNKLISDYQNAHTIYEKLQKEIGLLEESLEMTDYGIYKPHYDFGTSDEYKRHLIQLTEQEKILVRLNRAIICDTKWTVEGSEAKGRKMTKQTHKLMLRAFNGESDAAIAKVRWNNALKMEERIRKAFDAINKAAEVNRSHITTEYLDIKIQKLRLTHEYQEKIKQEKDEQRQIQEEMREEAKARREIERAKEEAEKEESRYQKALEKAREEAQKASGEKLEKMNEKLKQLEEQLKAAQEMKQRAISRAQLTKSGHIYIISNIGSFGEDIFKIGMTRRLEPNDRVRELGGASVPFSFDIHAMAYSDNAPELENKLHKHFETKRINLVNNRKEFFSIQMDELENWARENNIELSLTKLAEAREYRESLALRLQGEDAITKAIQKEVPESIEALFSDDDDDEG